MTTAQRWTDAELSRRCRRADSAGWRELIRRQTPLVYRLALGMLRDPLEAEDACQEVFMRVHRSFGSHDATRTLAPWVSRIAYHVCLRRLQSGGRKQAARADRSLQGDVRDSRIDSPEQQVATREAHRLLEAAFRELSAQDRALLTLRYREGLSDAEVAGAVGMPVNTVKTRIFRARKKLRERLGSGPDGGAR